MFLLLTILAADVVSPNAQAWALLEAGATEKSAEHREHAVGALGLLPGSARARAMAEKALEDGTPAVRAAAAGSLGQMKARPSIPLMRKKLDAERDGEVAVALIAALYGMDDPAGHEGYYAILTGEKKSGESLVEEQLKMIRDPKAVAKLGFEVGIGFVPFGGLGYRVFRMVTKDDTSPIRAAAALRIAKDPDPRSAAALVKAASDEKWLVRNAAVEALAIRGERRHASVVSPLMTDEHLPVRYTAAAATIRLTTSAVASKAVTPRSTPTVPR
jgi:HEAT repeat protein